ETDDLDVLQAKINVKNTEALIPELMAMERKAQIRLCVLRGTPPRDLTGELGIGPIPDAPSEVELGMPADLLRRRPDVRKAERQVAAQSEQIGVAAADLLPQMSIRGSIGHSAEDLSDLWRSSSTTGIILPGFDWDVLNYGRIKNNVDLQETKFHQQVLHYRQTVLRANADVERAVVSFLQAQSRVGFLMESVDANQEAIEVASAQYRAGEVNFNEIFTLQSFLVQEQDALAVAHGDVARSLIAIYKALGGGWEMRRDCLSDCSTVGSVESVSEQIIQESISGQRVRPSVTDEPAVTETSPSSGSQEKSPAPSNVSASELLHLGPPDSEALPRPEAE
ncbi:MAG: TolC family protein, partial [Rubripirellula sp.]